jgi:FeS assembly SUF system protein
MSDNYIQHSAIKILQTIYDPEIPVNIWDLGLVYGVSIDSDGVCTVVMTFTSPSCPVIDILPKQVREALSNIKGISEVIIEVVWDPKWDMSLVSEEIQLELGIL